MDISWICHGIVMGYIMDNGDTNGNILGSIGIELDPRMGWYVSTMYIYIYIYISQAIFCWDVP